MDYSGESRSLPRADIAYLLSCQEYNRNRISVVFVPGFWHQLHRIPD